MSAFGPKRTSQVAPHMSAFGGKADIAIIRKASPEQSRSRSMIWLLCGCGLPPSEAVIDAPICLNRA